VYFVDKLGFSTILYKNILFGSRDEMGEKILKLESKNWSSGSLWIKIAICAAILANFLFASPNFAQNTQLPSNGNKWNVPERKIPWPTEGSDSISYEEIKKYPIEWVQDKYGIDGAADIVTNCLLIELNKIRSENWLPPFSLDKKLMKAAQDYAEEMYKNKRCSHTGKNWDGYKERAKKAWYKWYVRENIWYNLYTIESAVTKRKDSPWHFQTIIDPKVMYLWVGYYGDYRDNMFWGN